MSEIDRDRLRRISDFLRTEVADAGGFSSLTRESYLTDSSSRRNVERWIENIVNASIDIAKILLASAQARAPQTQIAESLSRFSRLRNILAYEYLDVRWEQISAFLQQALPGYQELLRYTSRVVSSGDSLQP